MDTRGVGNEGGGALLAGRRQSHSRLHASAFGLSDRGWEDSPDPTSMGVRYTGRCLTSVQHNLRLHLKCEFSLNGSYRFECIFWWLKQVRATEKLAVFSDPDGSEVVAGRFFLT